MRFVALLALLAWFPARPANPPARRLCASSVPRCRRGSRDRIVAPAERAALDLVFESLVVVSIDADGNRRVRPVLAERMPDVDGVDFSFRLRSDRGWVKGDPVTVHDLRHTVRLLHLDKGAELSWHDGIDPRIASESPRNARIKLMHGSVEPWPWFTFYVMPKMFRNGELKLDDETFLKSPVGSGPFRFDGVFKDDVAPYARFRPNPGHGGPALPVREIRWFGSQDPKEITKIAPDVALGYDTAMWKNLVQLGLKPPIAAPSRRVEYVAVNQRIPALAQLDLRRFLGTALQLEPPANGLAPNDSWTSLPRIPKSWHRPLEAAPLAKALSGKPLVLSLKFAGSKALADDVIAQWEAIAAAAKWNLKIQPVPLSPSALAEALRKHDYDLALTHEDLGDEIPRLTALFDPATLDPGGSNVLGALLPGQLRAELFRTRQFPRLVQWVHNLHDHIHETMPLIPLRPVPTIAVGVSRRWQWTPGDGVRPFADWSAWRELP